MVPLGDPEEVAGFSGKVALVKRLTLWCRMYRLSIHYHASEMTCRSPVFHSVFFHLDFLWQWGPLLNLSDQLRRKFSLNRPFEGGC